MKRSKKILVPLKGIQDGEHAFSFRITNAFFDEFDNSEILGGNLQLEIILHKGKQISNINFHLTGDVSVNCDKCLDKMDISINKSSIIYIRNTNEESDSEDYISVSEAESEVDLTHYFFETIVLELPYRKVHSESENGCNPEMLKKLNEHITKEVNNTDPRWNGLKDLLNNN